MTMKSRNIGQNGNFVSRVKNFLFKSLDKMSPLKHTYSNANFSSWRNLAGNEARKYYRRRNKNQLRQFYLLIIDPSQFTPDGTDF